MSRRHYEVLFAYTSHTTKQLLFHAAMLEKEAYFGQSEYSGRSIHTLFFHMLDTARSWRVAIETGQQPPRLQAEGYATPESLREGFAQEREAWHALLERLSDEEIDRPIQLTSLRGQQYSLELWRIFEHLVLHGMQHHTEIAHLLTSKGHSPGDIDFIFYRR